MIFTTTEERTIYVVKTRLNILKDEFKLKKEKNHNITNIEGIWGFFLCVYPNENDFPSSFDNIKLYQNIPS